MDITADNGFIAIVTKGSQPASGDWVAAEWTRTQPLGTTVTISRQSTEYRFVKVTGTVDGATDSAWLRVLVGPSGGDINLTAAATYDFWIKVQDSPETPAILAGSITVT